MVHAIEAYTSRHKKNPMSDQLARQALDLLRRTSAPPCRDGKNIEARSKMLLGSMLAGMAFANAPVAAVHALAYPIGAHLPCAAWAVERARSHGRDALQSPAAEGALCGARADSSIRGRATCRPREAAARFVDALADICRDCEVPASLAEVGVGEATCQLSQTDAMKQTRLLVNNPREVTLRGRLRDLRGGARWKDHAGRLITRGTRIVPSQGRLWSMDQFEAFKAMGDSGRAPAQAFFGGQQNGFGDRAKATLDVARLSPADLAASPRQRGCIRASGLGARVLRRAAEELRGGEVAPDPTASFVSAENLRSAGWSAPRPISTSADPAWRKGPNSPTFGQVERKFAALFTRMGRAAPAPVSSTTR